MRLQLLALLLAFGLVGCEGFSKEDCHEIAANIQYAKLLCQSEWSDDQEKFDKCVAGIDTGSAATRLGCLFVKEQPECVETSSQPCPQ